jgi:hypothetical protein
MNKNELKAMIREEVERVDEGAFTMMDAARSIQAIMSKLDQSRLLDNNLRHKLKNLVAIMRTGTGSRYDD